MTLPAESPIEELASDAESSQLASPATEDASIEMDDVSAFDVLEKPAAPRPINSTVSVSYDDSESIEIELNSDELAAEGEISSKQLEHLLASSYEV